MQGRSLNPFSLDAAISKSSLPSPFKSPAAKLVQVEFEDYAGIAI
jgi:hypothetical protein